MFFFIKALAGNFNFTRLFSIIQGVADLLIFLLLLAEKIKSTNSQLTEIISWHKHLLSQKTK